MQNFYADFQVFAKPVGATCNLSCSYCYYLDKSDLFPKKYSPKMSEDILELYINQHIAASNSGMISFSWHGGEPMLAGLDYYRKIVSIQNKIKPAGTIILNGIQTNGTLINDEWCKFFKTENFSVGISLDGPAEFHSKFRKNKEGKSSFDDVLAGLKLLQKYGLNADILCVVNSANVSKPLNVYRFFRELNVAYISFIPLVEQIDDSANVNFRSVKACDFGMFLCAVFDEWKQFDIGKIKVQIFEETISTAFDVEHQLCIFKKTCGRVPVVEKNGDFYSCDHYVDSKHLVGNISDITVGEMLELEKQTGFGCKKFTSLPEYCLKCEYLKMCNGECPKYRFISTLEGESGLNYLCEAYKMFFKHSRPFVEMVAKAFKSG